MIIFLTNLMIFILKIIFILKYPNMIFLKYIINVLTINNLIDNQLNYLFLHMSFMFQRQYY